MEYCCHVWAGALDIFLELLVKLQKWICWNVGPSLAASLEPLIHSQNVASISLFNRYYFSKCSSELDELVPLPYSQGSFILVIFIALDFLERQFLSLWWEHQSDHFQKLSHHFSAMDQCDKYQTFLIFMTLKCCSNMLVQRNTSHGLWSSIEFVKFCFFFYSKNHFLCTMKVVEVMLLK